MKKGIMIMALAAMALAGCKTKERVVTIETVRTDTTYITRHERDSIYMHDSTHVSEKQRGDTIFVEVDRWRTRYVERLKNDTIREATHDTVPRPYPVVQEVPAELTWWQRARIGLGDAVLLFLVIGAIALILRRRW